MGVPRAEGNSPPAGDGTCHPRTILEEGCGFEPPAAAPGPVTGTPKAPAEARGLSLSGLVGSCVVAVPPPPHHKLPKTQDSGRGLSSPSCGPSARAGRSVLAVLAHTSALAPQVTWRPVGPERPHLNVAPRLRVVSPPRERPSPTSSMTVAGFQAARGQGFLRPRLRTSALTLPRGRISFLSRWSRTAFSPWFGQQDAAGVTKPPAESLPAGRGGRCGPVLRSTTRLST